LDAASAGAFRRRWAETKAVMATSKGAIHRTMEGYHMHASTELPADSSDDPGDLLLYRIRGEYLEMPGLRLTIEQAVRLWQMDAATCNSALMRLVADRFLTRTRHGAYVRLDQA
jgi:hypothetical protein